MKLHSHHSFRSSRPIVEFGLFQVRLHNAPQNGWRKVQKSVFTEEYEAFLRLLRRARRSAGLTQQTLAAKLRTTQSVVSKCERGERRLDVVELRAWCRALRVPFPTFAATLDERLSRMNHDQ